MEEDKMPQQLKGGEKVSENTAYCSVCDKQRKIKSFHIDKKGFMICELECGHKKAFCFLWSLKTCPECNYPKNPSNANYCGMCGYEFKGGVSR